MARPKPSPKKPAASTPKPGKSIAFRTTSEYAEWVDALAADNRSTVAGLIDQALAKYAKDRGFNPPPER